MTGDKTALLVIDVQQGLFEYKLPIYMADELLENINNLVKKAHENDAPVVYIQHTNKKHLKQNSREWQFHSAIKPQKRDHHIHKQSGNAFMNTGLAELLHSLGVKQVIACGLVTQGCVRATCLGGLKLGFDVVLANDAHSTTGKTADNIIKRTHKELSEAGVTLLPAEEVVF